MGKEPTSRLFVGSKAITATQLLVPLATYSVRPSALTPARSATAEQRGRRRTRGNRLDDFVASRVDDRHGVAIGVGHHDVRRRAWRQWPTDAGQRRSVSVLCHSSNRPPTPSRRKRCAAPDRRAPPPRPTAQLRSAFGPASGPIAYVGLVAQQTNAERHSFRPRSRGERAAGQVDFRQDVFQIQRDPQRFSRAIDGQPDGQRAFGLRFDAAS